VGENINKPVNDADTSISAGINKNREIFPPNVTKK
jgi:hypothetical protein